LLIKRFFEILPETILDYWISQWFAKSTGRYKEISDDMFVGVYGASVVLFTCGILVRGLVFSFVSIKKSYTLHDRMLNSVLYATKNFFDTTPLGRVLNAFARHQYAIDAQLADSLMQLLQYVPLCTGAMLLCSIVMWQTIGVFVGGALVAALILLYVGGTEQKLRNKEALTKSTIFSHLTASLEGLFSIRAYECQDRFVDLYIQKIDENHKYMFGTMESKQNTLLLFYV
jgi:ABC-type multidrug transport system fused ATPase/permease subunit